jgi:hypothetical protein
MAHRLANRRQVLAGDEMISNRPAIRWFDRPISNSPELHLQPRSFLLMAGAPKAATVNQVNHPLQQRTIEGNPKKFPDVIPKS